MRSETRHFPTKARRLIREADTMLGVKLNDAAGRTAYLAGFHAAQAFIFEREGKAAKTHRGVHTEFQRLTKGNCGFDPELSVFLSKTYDLKSIADYETGPGSEVSPERAMEAVVMARRFVAGIVALLSTTEHAP